MDVWNVGVLPQNYTASQPWRPRLETSLWKPQNSHHDLKSLERVLRSTRAIWKVHELALLLRVGTLWRGGDGLFFEVPPLASDPLLTTLHPLIENVLQTIDHFEISCLRAPFSWLEKPRNLMGMRSGLHWLDGWVVGFLIHFFQAEYRIQSRNADAALRK
jgi:hypothetical protein